MPQSKITDAFKDTWGKPPEVVSSSPARANLIGEHIDYNGGHVLPFAIPFRLTVAASLSNGDSLRLVSKELGSAELRFPIERAGDWSDTARGIFWLATRLGLKVSGDYYIESKIPLGSGLSSSAAFEMALFGAIFALNKKDMPFKELALLGQRVENEFLGVQSGIMDQMASALGRKDHLLLLDCATIEHQYVKWPKSDSALWVIHSGITRTLAKSEYNKRRAECDQALSAINSSLHSSYQYLAKVPMEVVEKMADELGNVIYRRAKHVVSETKRVHNVVDALQKGEVKAVGRALFESHESLRRDYEVSCEELDLLVELAKNFGALGGRLVGAGFGGAAIFLVPGEKESEFLKIPNIYREKTKKEPMMWKVWPDDGLKVERLS